MRETVDLFADEEENDFVVSNMKNSIDWKLENKAPKEKKKRKKLADKPTQGKVFEIEHYTNMALRQM